jgi:hypothetical protein
LPPNVAVGNRIARCILAERGRCCDLTDVQGKYLQPPRPGSAQTSIWEGATTCLG